MVPIRVLAIAGSPRRNGNSETLLDWVVEGMSRSPDVSATKIVLNDAEINPCRGCNACEKLNQCVIRDGMDILNEQIIEADCIILSAPIYCMSICAQAKAFVDRAQVFRSRKYVLKLPVVPKERVGKRLGVFLSTAGQDWDYVFDASIPVVKCFFHVVEVRNKDMHYLMVRNVDEKGAIEADQYAKRDAFELGDKLVQILTERLSE